MSTKRCPACSTALVQEPYVIDGESIMFWVCPEGDWEEPVEDAPEEAAESVINQ